MSDAIKPRLTLSHSTLHVTNFEATLSFYCDVLGFMVSNRGTVPGDTQIAFISQDPNNHHQIAMVEVPATGDSGFVLADHLAFRTGSLDDLRVIREKLVAAKIDPIIPICHGNAWSLYFPDLEGNGLECFVDTPFHVAQPYVQNFDLDQSDAEILASTEALVESEPEFQPMAEWQQNFAQRLNP